MIRIIALLALTSLLVPSTYSQTGVSVSPPRLYFESVPGNSSLQKVTVTNVSLKNTLELAVTLNDWSYDIKGENIIQPAGTQPNSCAGWITVADEDKFFSLKPGEKKDINITITSPLPLTDTLAAHTAMLFVTQMNPVNDVDQKGANIKVSVRSGIKIFHQAAGNKQKKAEIEKMSFDKTNNSISLVFSNTGNSWCDGTIYTDLVNTATGKKSQAEPVVFYTMPGNKRMMSLPLPEKPEKGKYTASVIMDYGVPDMIEIAELTFNVE